MNAAPGGQYALGRRRFLQWSAVAAVGWGASRAPAGDESTAHQPAADSALQVPAGDPTGRESAVYRRANTDWLAACRLGLGVHWTAQTAPRQGPPLPFREAVEKFDLPGFLAAVEHARVDYVLFTATHALQYLPCPHEVLDRLLPGRTCERDLLSELATELAARGKHLLLYYNHSCNARQDLAWEEAVGYRAADKSRFAAHLRELVAVLGERYGAKLRAWWFDSPYSLDPRGPHNSVTTELGGFCFPWEEFTAAAKRGHAERLVTYNPGVAETFLYTAHQDYWSGELVQLDAPPQARYLPSGLQWFGWACLDEVRWVHTDRDAPAAAPRFSCAEAAAFVRACNQRQAPMTFNVDIYQDGTPAPDSVELLHQVRAALDA